LGRSRCSGAIGARSGATAPPTTASTQPPGVQKSFCMSITINTLR